MTMKTVSTATATLALLAMGAAWPADAQEAEERLEDPEALECLPLLRIDRTKVIDDQNILFFAKGGKIYRNQLPRKCPGLAREDAFMYETSMNRLCRLDMITVLRNIGFGFSSGPSCGLGKFHPISKEAADAILGRKE